MTLTVSASSTALALVSSGQRAQSDAASLYAADRALQKAELAAAEARLTEADGWSTALSSGRGEGYLTSREAERLKARTAHLTKALDRLLSAAGKTPTGATVAVVSGAATGSGGMTLAASAQRIDGVYTDWKSGLSPEQYYNDAKRSDQVMLTAEEVLNVDTAGGDDAVAITAGLVEAIYTGNDADSVSITAQLVRDIHTDEDPNDAPDGRQGADAVAINAIAVSSVYTGGGNDAVAISAHLADSIYTGDGNDSLRINADLVGGIDGGAGNDRIDVSAIAGRYWTGLGDTPTVPDLSTPEARLAATTRTGTIDGGAGTDRIRVTAAGPIGVMGGAGDDSITLDGGSVGLFYGLGDGNDRVALGAGTEVLIRLGSGFTGFSVEQGEDSLTLRAGSGSVTLSGVGRAGMIAVQQGGGAVQILSPGPTLDRAA